MAEDVELVLSGRAFAGWKSLRVTRSIESGSGSFEFDVSERYALEPELRAIRPGEPAVIRIGTDTLITGYVDEVSVAIDGDSHGIAVRGRDRVADLIDCAPDIEPAAQWQNYSLLELAKLLAKPFGIAVRSNVDLGARFELVAMSAGQRVWDLIEQQARYRQALAISDGLGGLLFTRAGTRRLGTSIVEGENMLRGTATYSDLERYSHYVVKGQGLDLGGNVGALAGKAVGRATDRKLVLAKRHRPLLLVADKVVDSQRCIQRAQWEALTRAARGARAEVDVAGWREGGGELWPLNCLVGLRSPTLGLAEDFLIASVAYSLDEGGAITSLSLVRRDAFTLAPEPEPSTKYGYQVEADATEGEADE